MEIIAHRGACFAAPENSRAAFEIAIAQGAVRLELDLQMTADEHAVVCHDPTTARTGDRVLDIARHPLSEVTAVRLPNSETLPTFADICALAAGRVQLDVELKTATPTAIRRVLDTLREYDLLERALLTSFLPPALHAIREAGYRGQLGLLIGSRSLAPTQRKYEAWPIPTMASCGADTLVIHHRLLHRLLYRALRQNRQGIMVWTSLEDELVDPPQRATLYRKLADQQTDGVILGRIEEALPILSRTSTR